MRSVIAALAVLTVFAGCGFTTAEELLGGPVGSPATASSSSSSASSSSVSSSSASSSSASSTGAGGGTGSSSSASGTGGGAPACLTCDAPVQSGALADPEEKEISGVVSSLSHPGVYYVHNDSGDVARFFAVDATGAALATFPVSGAAAVDWEDIARGPCPAGTCVYLGDIGDNLEKRASYTIYRVTEPAAITSATLAAEALPFTYPDGSHNAETLLVHPTTGVITIVTKTTAPLSGIYEFPQPLTPGQSVVLKKVGDYSVPQGIPLVTGGDVHPLAQGVLIRSYTDVFYYPMKPGATVASALMGAGCIEPAPFEMQGEAIGWLASGSGYITTSEGAGAPIHTVACKKP